MSAAAWDVADAAGGPSVARHREGITCVLPGGLVCTEHFFQVPLDWRTGGDATITVFLREVRLRDTAERQKAEPVPHVIYLQGGPGFPSPRLVGVGGWLKRLLTDGQGQVVLLLDQRGTGRSTPITPHGLAAMADGQGQAEYLSHFRADSIVRDCEAIRRAVLGDRKWRVLGQSFGGFCLLHYLCAAPQAIEFGIFTGGLPPLRASARSVYDRTFQRVLEKNVEFYQRYPHDAALVRRIVASLAADPPAMPSGGLLTPRRFLQLGLCLGSGSGMEELHNLLEWAFPEGEGAPAGPAEEAPPRRGGLLGALQSRLSFGRRRTGEPEVSRERVSRSFLRQVCAMQAWESNPLYAVLHEAIYCQGAGTGPSDWAAQRARGAERFRRHFDVEAAMRRAPVRGPRKASVDLSRCSAEDPAFGEEPFAFALPSGEWVQPVFFTGEMVFPWMFDGDYESLAPLKDAAERLAAKGDWPELYDEERLGRAGVPCVAAVYRRDMYVDLEYSLETARAMKGACEVWQSLKYEHSALRDDGFALLDKLLSILRAAEPEDAADT